MLLLTFRASSVSAGMLGTSMRVCVYVCLCCKRSRRSKDQLFQYTWAKYAHMLGSSAGTCGMALILRVTKWVRNLCWPNFKHVQQTPSFRCARQNGTSHGQSYCKNISSLFLNSPLISYATVGFGHRTVFPKKRKCTLIKTC